MASAPSVPGFIGSHFQALAAVFESRGSTTAIFRRSSARPSVIALVRHGEQQVPNTGVMLLGVNSGAYFYRVRNLLQSATLVVLALPVYLYHWRKAQRSA